MKIKYLKILILFLIPIHLLMFSLPSSSLTEEAKNTTFKINGKVINKIYTPVKNSYIYYPANDILCELGFTLSETQKGKKITITREDIKVEVSTTDVMVDGKSVYVGEKPLIYSKNCYFLCYNAFLKVFRIIPTYDETNNTVNVSVDDSIYKELLLLNADRFAKGKDIIKLNERNEKIFIKAKTIITSIINPRMSELEKEYEIHDYITQNVQYDDDTALGTKITPESYHVEGAIINNYAVCGGISEAMSLLLKMVSIESKVVTGWVGTARHAWNLVELSGKYYYVDATADLIPNDWITYNYVMFNMTTEECLKTGHRFNEKLPVYDNREFSFLRKIEGDNVDYSMWLTREKDIVYFSNLHDQKRLYKARTNSNVTRLTDESAYCLYLKDDSVIYASTDNAGWTYLCEVKKDGSNRQVHMKGVNSIDYAKDLICYTRYSSINDSYDFYVNNLDFNNEKLIAESSRFFDRISENLPYIIYGNYHTKDSPAHIFSYDTRNGNKKELFNGIVNAEEIYNGYYYVLSGSKAYELSFDGTKSNVLINLERHNFSDTTCYFYNTYFYYDVNSENTIKKYRVSLKTKAVEEFNGSYWSITPNSSQFSSAKALPTTSNVIVDGTKVSFKAYNINGNNYFKLRDLAAALNGSSKQFDIEWNGNKNTINLISSKSYNIVGGELETNNDVAVKTAVSSAAKLYLDDKEIQITAFLIDGNNYFKLRDIGACINFGVLWDGNTNSIIIDSSTGYSDAR